MNGKYRSPNWTIIIEIYLAIQAMIVGYAGSAFADGPLSGVIEDAGGNGPWFVLFCGTGFGLLVTAAVEMRHRRNAEPRYMLDESCRTRFAIMRESLNGLMVVFWSYAIVALLQADEILTSVLATSVQAIGFHLAVAIENIKAQRLPFEDKRSRDYRLG